MLRENIAYGNARSKNPRGNRGTSLSAAFSATKANNSVEEGRSTLIVPDLIMGRSEFELAMEFDSLTLSPGLDILVSIVSECFERIFQRNYAGGNAG